MMTTLEAKANEYAQTLHPIDIDEVSVIVRDFCAGYTEALRWRVMADEEPEPFENVLLSAGSLPDIFIGFFDGENFVCRQSREGIEYFRVLHWRPIE